MRTTNHIRDHGVDLDKLFARNRQIRFLLPVRNPMDCAVSNQKKAHVRFLGGIKGVTPVKQVLEAILDEILWFEQCRAKYPDRFWVFFEHEFGRPTLVELASFLRLEPYEEWCVNALAGFDNKSRYEHPDDLILFYRRAVVTKFADYPDTAGRLLRFVEKVSATKQPL